jgi:hypothetical protein
MLGVALVAGFVHGLPCQCGGDRVTVGAVASAAVHLPLEERVRERLLGLCALSLVALVADIRLGRRLQYRVARDVHLVAVDAGDFVHRVFAGMPSETDVTGMALEALSVLCLDAGGAGRVEKRRRRSLLATPHSTRVLARRSVASLALQLAVPEGTTRIRGHGMFRAEDSQY